MLKFTVKAVNKVYKSTGNVTLKCWGAFVTSGSNRDLLRKLDSWLILIVIYMLNNFNLHGCIFIRYNSYHEEKKLNENRCDLKSF